MVGDLGLEATPIGFGDAVAKDRAELVGTADAAIEVQQTLSHSIESRPLFEDQVGAVLDLAAEQPVDAIRDAVGIRAGIKGHQLTQPALNRDLQVSRGEAVGELLETFRVRALHEGVGGLAEEDAVALELACQVLVLVDADSRIERKVRTDAQEHAAPLTVAQVEVVLPHETGAHLDAIAAAGRRITHSDSSVFAALEDDHDPEARAVTLVKRLHPVFPPYPFGRLHDRDALSRCQPADKAVVALRDLSEVGPRNRTHLPTLVEEADNHGRLLHRLNDGVEQHTIEARVLKADALLVVLDERVHGGPPEDGSRTIPIVGGPPFASYSYTGISRGGAPCLVHCPASFGSYTRACHPELAKDPYSSGHNMGSF